MLSEFDEMSQSSDDDADDESEKETQDDKGSNEIYWKLLVLVWDEWRIYI